MKIYGTYLLGTEQQQEHLGFNKTFMQDIGVYLTENISLETPVVLTLISTASGRTELWADFRILCEGRTGEFIKLKDCQFKK